MYLLQLGLPLILQNMILWQICQKAWSLLASNVCKALAEDWKFQSSLLCCQLKLKSLWTEQFECIMIHFSRTIRMDIAYLPLTPVFHTVLVYLRPDTMLLVTWKENFRLCGLPSFSVNHKPLGFPSSGISRTMSGLSGERIDSWMNFTSGSRVSVVKEGKELLCARNKEKPFKTKKGKRWIRHTFKKFIVSMECKTLETESWNAESQILISKHTPLPSN